MSEEIKKTVVEPIEKKKTARKPRSAKTTTKTTKEEKKENVGLEDNVKEESEQREYLPSDLIPCKNIFAGTTVLTGNKTKTNYVWEGFGVVEYVEYQDLRSEILNKRSAYIYEPLIMIEDEHIVKSFKGLFELYKNMKTPEELEDLLHNGTEAELRKAIEEIPFGLQESLRSLAATMLQEGTLDSVRKVRMIDDLLDTSLSEQLGMFTK